MRIKDNGNSIAVWLSARDTYDWAHKAGAVWPCSGLSDKRIFAAFDTNGLYELTVNGRWDHTIDSAEFNAVMADHIGTKILPDHPVWFVTVGQFSG